MSDTAASILPARPGSPAAMDIFDMWANLAHCRYALAVAHRVLSEADAADPLARELALDVIASTLERAGGAP